MKNNANLVGIDKSWQKMIKSWQKFVEGNKN